MKSETKNTFGLTKLEEENYQKLENNILESVKNCTYSTAKRLLENVQYRIENELKLT